MRELPTAESPPDEKVLSDVREHGWHIIKVPERGSTPGWAFSIGLHHSYQHAEVMLFGLPLDAMQAIINNLGSDVARGARYPAATESNQVLEGYRCAFRAVHPRWYGPFLGYATWFYQGDDFPVVQCLWPDKQGHLPDSADFDSDLVGLQPLLEFPDPARARAVELLHSLDI